MVVDPFAVVDVKVPGVMVIVVAPVVNQVSVPLAPEVMLVGDAVNETITGFGPNDFDEVTELQPASSKQPSRISTLAQRANAEA